MKKKDTFLQEFEDLKKKHNVEMEVSMDFPMYKVLPDDVKLALLVLQKHNVQYQLSVKEVKDDNKS